MTYTTTGKIFLIGHTTQINPSFKKREIVVTRDDRDSKTSPLIMLELINTDIARFPNLKVGDSVSISFVIRGNAFTPKGGKTKYFNNLRILTIESTPNNDKDSTTKSVPSVPVTAFLGESNLQ